MSCALERGSAARPVWLPPARTCVQGVGSEVGWWVMWLGTGLYLPVGSLALQARSVELSDSEVASAGWIYRES